MKYIRSLVVITIGLFLVGLRGSRVGRAGQRASQGVADGPEDVISGHWKAVVKHTWAAIKDKNLLLMGAALAYYATLTFFPATLGLASLYTTIAGTQGLQTLLGNLHQAVPPSIASLVQTVLSPLTHAGRGSLGLATVISLALVLWTTSGGVSNLVKATNVAYGVEEGRGFVKLRLVSVVLSLAFIGIAALVCVLLVLNGGSLQSFGVPHVLAQWFPWVRWPLLVVVVSMALAAVYRYAPNRDNPRWEWVSWGAAAATILWLLVTAVFFYYVQHFGSYNHSYGSFASIVILMIWFNITSVIVLVGAQVNKKLEIASASGT